MLVIIGMSFELQMKKSHIKSHLSFSFLELFGENISNNWPCRTRKVFCFSTWRQKIPNKIKNKASNSDHAFGVIAREWDIIKWPWISRSRNYERIILVFLRWGKTARRTTEDCLLTFKSQLSVEKMFQLKRLRSIDYLQLECRHT